MRLVARMHLVYICYIQYSYPAISYSQAVFLLLLWVGTVRIFGQWREQKKRVSRFGRARSNSVWS